MTGLSKPSPEDQTGLTIKFWGVRGSIPCPGGGTVEYGGNTTCVELGWAEGRIIFDAGTGIRLLGEALGKGPGVSGHLFFTHTHWDHIQGFPFFSPAFQLGNGFHIYGVPSPNGKTIRQCLHEQMLHPNFPVPLQIMQGIVGFYDLRVGEQIQVGEATVVNRPLNHPGGSVGYRVSWQGVTVAFITDTEHYGDRLDDQVLALADGVDVLIIDATYTDEEYYHPTFGKQGWGHSTWQEAVKVAQAAGVRQLVLFHHDPSHTDHHLHRIGEAARQRFPDTLLAKEGMQIHLLPSPHPDTRASVHRWDPPRWSP